jgi:hypothetical protein
VKSTGRQFNTLLSLPDLQIFYFKLLQAYDFKNIAANCYCSGNSLNFRIQSARLCIFTQSTIHCSKSGSNNFQLRVTLPASSFKNIFFGYPDLHWTVQHICFSSFSFKQSFAWVLETHNRSLPLFYVQWIYDSWGQNLFLAVMDRE